MKTISELEELTLKWADDKGILKNGDKRTQMLKFISEYGELQTARYNSNSIDVIDAIGDCMVVLTSLCYLHGIKLPEASDSTIGVCVGLSIDAVGKLSDAIIKDTTVIGHIADIISNLAVIAVSYKTNLEYCWESAYNEIKTRTGVTNEYGNFVKDEDLT